MPFLIIVGGQITKHNFDYLSTPTGRRLDDTIVPGKIPSPKKELPKDSNTFAIEIMSKDIESLEQDTPTAEALKIFKTKNLHHLPITKKGTLKGLVSDRDILWLEKFDVNRNTGLSKFMSKTVLCCEEETPVSDIAKVMVNEHISALPVIDKDAKLVGIVTHHDILRWIYDF